MPKAGMVISHWYQLIENFQASSAGVYDGVLKSIECRSVPQMRDSRIEHKEGGIDSANREYLRITRGGLIFDICAAPFGNGFFFSWWLTGPPQGGWLFLLAAVLFVFFLAGVCSWVGYALGTSFDTNPFTSYLVGSFFSAITVVIGTPVILYGIGLAIRQGHIDLEDVVLATPFVGSLYERIFSPPTYYKIDTALMFQESVHNSVLEVIDALTKEKGVRALSDEERKPIMKRFAASA